MLRFVCEYCRESVRVKEAFAGRKGRCPHCGRRVTIPGTRLPDADDNVSALAAALTGEEPDDEPGTVPPPPTTAKPDSDEFDLVDLEAAVDFETDCYPAIRPKDTPPSLVAVLVQRDAEPPVPEPLAPAKVSWQNVLLIVLALLVVGMITVMIVWMRCH